MLRRYRVGCFSGPRSTHGVVSRPPQTIDLDKERVSIPESPFYVSLELEVVSSATLEEFIEVVLLLADTGSSREHWVGGMVLAAQSNQGSGYELGLVTETEIAAPKNTMGFHEAVGVFWHAKLGRHPSRR